MSKAIELTNVPAVDAGPLTPQALANEVADLIQRKNSPFAAADVFLKQVAMQDGSHQRQFIIDVQRDLKELRDQTVLPTLTLCSEQIGQSGHNTDSEVALATTTHEALQHMQVQQNSDDIANFTAEAAKVSAVQAAEALTPLTDHESRMLDLDSTPDKFGISDNDEALMSRSKFVNATSLLRDYPLISDWMTRSCGTDRITQSDLQRLLSKQITIHDPKRTVVYDDLAYLNSNWNNGTLLQIQSTDSHTNVKYLDMIKVRNPAVGYFEEQALSAPENTSAYNR